MNENETTAVEVIDVTDKNSIYYEYPGELRSYVEYIGTLSQQIWKAFDELELLLDECDDYRERYFEETFYELRNDAEDLIAEVDDEVEKKNLTKDLKDFDERYDAIVDAWLNEDEEWVRGY